MLELKTFVAGIVHLQKFYLDWKFDVKDEMQIKVWYTPFKNLTSDQYAWLIKEYKNHNDQPPKSVKQLTDILVNVYYNRAKIKPENALDFVRGVISEKGGWEYGGKTEIYKTLEKYPPLHKTVKEFEDTIKSMSANDSYAADRFRRAYENNLREYASSYTFERLGIALPEPKNTLGSAALPYET